MRKFIIAGFGDTGESAARIILKHFSEVYVIDRKFKFLREEVVVSPEREVKLSDIVQKTDGMFLVKGDVLEEKIWKSLSLNSNDTVIIALPEDRDVIFCTLIIKNMYPDVTVIARANSTYSLGKIYRAGADYVAPLSSISAQTLAMSLLKGVEIGKDVKLSYSGINIEKFTVTENSKIRGISIGELDIRKKTGCTIITVLDEDDKPVEFTVSTTLRDGMNLLVAGKKEDILKFEKLI